MNIDKEKINILQDTYYYMYYNNKKNIKKSKIIKYFIYSISFLIIIILLIKIIKLKKKIKKLKINNIKIKEINNFRLNNFIKNYKNKKNNIHDNNKLDQEDYNLLQLYIENRTQFYINGRQKIMRRIKIDYNDSNIITFQDKINWLLVHDSPEDKYKYVDKILLRNYSKKILGKDICVPLIKVYNNVDEINLNELPNKFVLKCNHGSGMNIICTDKSTFNLTKAKLQLDKWMKINYGLKKYEYQYINVKKKIFSEIFLKDNITEYKFYCFNGKPKLIKVQAKYYKENIKMYHYYDLNWKITDLETNLSINFKLPNNIKFPKPKYLSKMIKYAKIFAKDFTFIRVDLYEFNDTIYLSELTFSPANLQSPYKNQKQRIYLGSLLDLSKINHTLKKKI